MRFAPVLTLLASELPGRSDPRSDPHGAVDAIRRVTALAEPDFVVSHWDSELEADAALTAAGNGEPAERLERLCVARLAGMAPVSQAVEVARTLALLFPDEPAVAAPLTGPVTLAGQLASRMGLAEASVELVAVCSDLLASLARTYVAAGVKLLLLCERTCAAGATRAGIEAGEIPLTRALSQLGCELVFVCPRAWNATEIDGVPCAQPWDGSGEAPAYALLDSRLWSLPEDDFQGVWTSALSAAKDSLLLSDGPVSAPLALGRLEMLRRLRFESCPAPGGCAEGHWPSAARVAMRSEAPTCAATSGAPPATRGCGCSSATHAGS
jgi:hypothetical protein